MGPEPSSRPETATDRTILIGFALLIFGGFIAEMLRDFSPVKLSIVLFPLFWAPLTALHEAGHALAAHAMGWRVEEVVIGFGRPLKRWRVGRTPVELRAVPITGYVIPIPRDGRLARGANAFIFFAGPGIELLAVGLVAALLGVDTLTSKSDSYIIIAAQTFCLAALTGVIINLIPHFGPDGSVSDGMGIAMSPFLNQEHFATRALYRERRRLEEAMAAGRNAEALAELEALLDAHPKVLELHLLAAQAEAAQGERMVALMRLQAARRMDHLKPGQRLQVDELMRQIRAR